METDKKLSKDRAPGEMTLRGTVTPDITGVPGERIDPATTPTKAELNELYGREVFKPDPGEIGDES